MPAKILFQVASLEAPAQALGRLLTLAHQQAKGCAFMDDFPQWGALGASSLGSQLLLVGEEDHLQRVLAWLSMEDTPWVIPCSRLEPVAILSSRCKALKPKGKGAAKRRAEARIAAGKSQLKNALNFDRPELATLPRIKVQSQSTGQSFWLYIQRKAEADATPRGCYGL